MQIEHATPELPDGSLRVSEKQGRWEYYHVVSHGDTCGKYIRKNNRDTAIALAMKDYYDKQRKSIQNEIREIEKLILLYESDPPEEVYNKLPHGRKELVTPICFTDDVYVKWWASKPYESNPLRPEELIYETDHGELVRSKSEMLIANAYNEMGIPYRYECKLYLNKAGYRFPDFTVLDVKRRRVIYHEHFGLLDDDNYRYDSIQKIDAYRKSGIHVGKNLFITHETSYSPFDIKTIKNMIKDMLQIV